jgi:hypothetical protein
MYDFDKSIKPEDIEFFGYNEGLPLKRPNSSGMLSNA